MPSGFPKRSKSFVRHATPSPTHSQEALPKFGHQPWAAGQGSPPSTHHPGLPGRSCHRTSPDSSLEKKEKSQTQVEKRWSTGCFWQGFLPANFVPSWGGNTELATKCKINSITTTLFTQANFCFSQQDIHDEGSSALVYVLKLLDLLFTNNKWSANQPFWVALENTTDTSAKENHDNFLFKKVIRSSWWETTLERVRSWIIIIKWVPIRCQAQFWMFTSTISLNLLKVIPWGRYLSPTTEETEAKEAMGNS